MIPGKERVTSQAPGPVPLLAGIRTCELPFFVAAVARKYDGPDVRGEYAALLDLADLEALPGREKHYALATVGRHCLGPAFRPAGTTALPSWRHRGAVSSDCPDAPNPRTEGSYLSSRSLSRRKIVLMISASAPMAAGPGSTATSPLSCSSQTDSAVATCPSTGRITSVVMLERSARAGTRSRPQQCHRGRNANGKPRENGSTGTGPYAPGLISRLISYPFETEPGTRDLNSRSSALSG